MNTGDDKEDGIGAELDRRFADLPRAVEPGRDLWPAIEARLDEDGGDARGHGFWRWGAVAAVLVAAVAVPVMLREAPVTEIPGAEDPVPVAAVPEANPTPAPEFGDQRLRLRNAATTSVQPGPEYEAAREELLASLEERMQGLEPEEREIVVRNIEAIRSALEAIDMALQDNPGDPLLQELMLKTYQSELDVMARVNGLAGPARRRTDL